MIRDLVEIAVGMVREERVREVRQTAEARAEERLLDLLLPPGPHVPPADAAAPERGAEPDARAAAGAAAGRQARRADGRDSSVQRDGACR